MKFQERLVLYTLLSATDVVVTSNLPKVSPLVRFLGGAFFFCVIGMVTTLGYKVKKRLIEIG